MPLGTGIAHNVAFPALDLTARIRGSVIGGTQGLIASEFPSSTGYRDIGISATGSISGDSTAIFLQGGDNLVRNNGTVTGGLGSAIHVVNFHDAWVYNDGTVNGTIKFETGSSFRLVNTNLVNGTVAAANTSGTIVNAGAIENTAGAVIAASSTSAVVVKNSGTLTGNVLAALLSDQADRMVNSGMVNGDVLLLGGNDKYTHAAGGSVAGTVKGGTGNDILRGSTAADIFNGEAGNDRLFGGGGEDVLTGGGDADLLSGGGQHDTFVFLTANDSTAAASDRITDFQHGLDQIDLANVNAGVLDFNGLGGFTGGGTGSVRYVLN
ncbi:MAG: M10 family metallopeptidase C-terminal domain-containing protein, partial [Alphaproteobacteria bacterium]|nr:M10 family metallopeptidase C-terminal domain-containing protein [Alphaproteobacteria bacterium]